MLPLPLILGSNNAVFNPSRLPGLKAWYSSDYGVYQDGAAHFTAASKQYLSCASNSSLQMGASNFTLCGWFKFDSLSASRPLISKWGSSGPLEYIVLTSGNQVFFYISTSSSLFFVGEPTTLSTNTWYFICAWSDGTNLNLQLNNGAVSQTAFTGSLQTGSSPLYLGYDPTDGFYNDGSMDSLFITKRVLTSAERTAIYNAGAGQTYSSAQTAIPSIFDSYAVSWWDMNEESGTRFDAIGTNDLTASNTTLISPTVNNGGFESDSGGTIAAPWTVITEGSSTVTDDTVAFYAGAHSCKFTIDSGGGRGLINQAILRAGDIYNYSFEAKGSSTSAVIAVDNTTAVIKSFTLTTSWAAYSGTFTALDNTFWVNGAGASTTSNLDQVTLTDLGPVGIAGIAAGLAQDGNFCASGNGTNQGFAITNAALPDITTEDLYVSFFFYPNRLNNFEKLFSFTNGTTLLYADYIVGSGVRFTESATGATVYAPGTNPLNLESWGCLECWYNHTAQTLNIRFNNGTKASSATTFTPVASTPTLTLMSASGVYFGGRFDNCRVSSFIPSDADATTAWNNGKGMKYAQYLAAGLPAVTAAYDFDKILGITADSTGNGLTLTNANSTGYAQGVDFEAGAASKIIDQSGNGNHLVQTTQANRPVYYSDVLNGKPIILFNGVNNFMSFVNSIASTPITVFAVTEHTASAANAILGTTLGGGLEYRINSSDKQNIVNETVGDIATGTSAISKTAYTLIDMSYDGSAYSFAINGADDGSGTSAATLSNPITTLGARTNGFSEFFTGGMASIIVYGAVLSTSQKNLVRNYLRNKWALY